MSKLGDSARMSFAKRVNDRMLQMGYNQSELARRAGLGRDNVSGYVRGRNFPNSSHLAKLAQALRVEPSYLLGATLEERNPAMAFDNVPPFSATEMPDKPGQMQVVMKKTLSVDQYMRLLDLLQEERKSKGK